MTTLGPTLVVVTLSLVMLVATRRRLRGTTLYPPWLWAIASLLCVVASEVIVGSPGGPGAPATHLRFLAAVTTFAPVMALLGARRPHHGAWQFIVLGLLATLAWPSVIGLVIRPGEALELHGAHQAFLVALVVLGGLQGMATRHWPSALLLAIGQALLAAPWTPLTPWASVAAGLGPWRVASATACAMFGIAAWAARGDEPGREELPAIDRRWLDYRDAFGLLWGLRVVQRFNIAAEQCGWPMALGWNGLTSRQNASQPPELSPATAADAEQTLENLLRRFVSAEWLAQRGVLPAKDRPAAT